VFLISLVLSSLSCAKEQNITEFPSLYQGVWDVSQESCSKKWSDTRLTITASAIEYWESSGVILKILSDSPNYLRVQLSMVGEGEGWIKDAKYTVKDSKLTETLDKYEPFRRVLCERIPKN